jgi:hypothetical protein
MWFGFVPNLLKYIYIPGLQKSFSLGTVKTTKLQNNPGHIFYSLILWSAKQKQIEKKSIQTL